MKLSKSKLALAKVINENGGWVDGAKFSSQDKDGNEVCFYSNSKPIKPLAGMSRWRSPIVTGYMGDYSIASNTLLKNWHQTCISREEYYQAYPKADEDGWIDHDGSKCPVATGVAVDVKYRDGGTMLNLPANLPHHTSRTAAPCWWNHDGIAGDIMAYRLHKPKVKPEFCESVMRSIPEPEAHEKLSPEAVEAAKIALMSESIEGLNRKPTIEQLVQDYRNAKEYAERLQKEYGDAAVKAESLAVEIRKKLLELQELIG